MPRAPHATSPDRIGVDAMHGRRPLFLAGYALRNGSPGVRQILARAASQGRWDADELVHRLAVLRKHDQDHEIAAALQPWATVQLARLLGTQGHAPSDAWAATLLLQAVRSAHGLAALRHEGRLLLLELLAQQGETDPELEEWLHSLRKNAPRLAVQTALVRANAGNPFRSGTPEQDTTAWAASVGESFRTNGLETPVVRPGPGPAFDRLSTVGPVAATTDAGPLVTVVVTPDESWTPSTVRSVLAQSYPALEILVVDWSGAVAAPDWTVDDVRVRRIAPDGATSSMHARNLAVADHAAGDLVTVASGTDWLHPRRIERQVRRLAEEPDAVACLASVVHATDDLVFGRAADEVFLVHPGPGTLLMRRAAFGTVGYWDTGAPTGLADQELVARLAAVTGRPVPSVGGAPLTIIRHQPAALGPHFVEPHARWYTSAYRTWHESAAPEALRLPVGPTAHRALPVPSTTTSDRAVEVDIAYVTDFRFPGGNSSISANEIQILDEGGYRVAMVHLESPVLPHDLRLNPSTLDVARRPGVHLATLDDAVRARLTIVRHPTVLQMAEPRRCALTTGSLAVIANHAPYEADLGGSHYDAAVVAANAAAIFGRTPVIYPESGLIRTLLGGMLDPRLLAEVNWTGVLRQPVAPQKRRRPARRRITGRPRPVIGRHSRDNRAKWPDADVLRAVYPVDGTADVRVLGGAASAQERTGIDVEAAWTVYPFGSRPVGEFLDELDFWVYIHGPELYESFGMAIVEALAAGLIVVLPDYMEQTFGDAAVYAEAGDVQPLVQRLWKDPAAYAAQSERAVAAAARYFSPDALLDRVARILDGGQGVPGR